MTLRGIPGGQGLGSGVKGVVQYSVGDIGQDQIVWRLVGVNEKLGFYSKCCREPLESLIWEVL